MSYRYANRVARLWPLLFVFLLCLFSYAANAQFGGYSFSQNTSATYAPINNGTVLAFGIGLDNERYLVTLPFPFSIANQTYTQAYVCINGYMTFGSPNPGSDASIINSAGTGFCAVAGMSANLASLNSTTELRCDTVGVAPFRTYIVQWRNFGFAGSSLLSVNFQIRLSEGSNNVTVMYGNCSLGGSSSIISTQVGLRGTSNSSHFHRTSSGSWTGTTQAIASNQYINFGTGGGPSSGLTYTFYSAPACSAPTAQPTNLTFTRSNTSITGAFSAAAGADNYLVLRTPGVPLTGRPVDGVTYNSGDVIGNGVVVSYGSPRTFTSSSLTPVTSYTHTIFSARGTNCQPGPKYDTASPLAGTALTSGPRAYSWLPATGSADFQDSANWFPSRIFETSSDTLFFNNGGNSIATNVGQLSMLRLEVNNNTTVALVGASGFASILVNDELKIQKGSTLKLGGATTVKFTQYTTTPANIFGKLVIDDNATFDGTYCSTSIYGEVDMAGAGASMSPSFSIVTGFTKFLPGSVYDHQRNGGAIPTATYDSASLMKFTGITTTAPTFNNNTFGRYGSVLWDCAQQTGNINISDISRIKGNFTVNNTNTGTLSLTGIRVDGNFTQQGGTIAFSGTGNLDIYGNTTLTAGTFDLRTFSRALTVRGDFFQANGHTITRTGTGVPGIIFGGELRQKAVFGGTVAAVPISYTLNNPLGVELTGNLNIAATASNTIGAGQWLGSGQFTYDATNTTLNYTSAFAVKASTIEWPAANGPSNITVNLSATVPANRLILPGSRNIPGLFTFTKGVVILNDANFTVNSYAGNNGSPLNGDTSFIATDSTGYFAMKVAPQTIGVANYNFPLGDLRDGFDRSTFTLSVFNNSQARMVGIRLRDRHHPADTCTTNYLNRYWTITDDGGSAPMAYKATYHFMWKDTVQGRGFFLHAYNGATWTRIPGSTGAPTGTASSTMIGGDTLQNTVFPLGGNDYTGKASDGNVYSWTGAVSTDFKVAGNWTPARINPGLYDVLQFNDGLTDTVKNIPQTHSVSKIRFINNTSVVMQAAPPVNNGYFELVSDANPQTDELYVEQGSSVLMNGTTAPLRFRLLGTLATATIAGKIEIVNTSIYPNTLTFTGNKATITATGMLAAGTTSNSGQAIISDTGSMMYGTYEHKYTTTNGGSPVFTWAPGSNYLVTGFTTATTYTVNDAYDLTWNCPNQTSTMNGFSANINVANNCKVISTGTGSVALYGNLRNYLQTGGNTRFVNTSISNDFIQSGGTIAAGVNGAYLNFNGTGGRQSPSFLNVAPTGGLFYQITNPDGINLIGTGGLTGSFALNTNGGIIVSSTANPAITSNLSLAYAASGSALVYDVAADMTADPYLFPAVNGPAKLRLTFPTAKNTLTLPWNRTLPDSLCLLQGNLIIGANDLTIGTSVITPGGITYSSGGIQATTGKITRWYSPARVPTAAGSNLGFYPFMIGPAKRFAWLYFQNAAALTNGGSITMGYNELAGTTNGLSIVDGSVTITSRLNSNWMISTGGGLTTVTGGIGLRLGSEGIATTQATTLRVMQSASVAGTHSSAGGTSPYYYADRGGLSIADLNGVSYYIGNGGGILNNVWTSIATGSWGSAANWDQGSVPPAGADVVIGNNTVISINGVSTSIRSLAVQTTGTFMHNLGSIAVDSNIVNNGTFSLGGGIISNGPLNGGKQYFNNYGKLKVSSGTMRINGNLALLTGSGFEQTGGSIFIDGNASGVGINSVPYGTYLLNILSPEFVATGGSITIVDPPASTGTLTSSALYAVAGTIATVTGAGHSLILGNGTSTTAGVNTNGFELQSRMQLGSLVINGTPNTANRKVTLSSVQLMLSGNMTLNNTGAEFVMNQRIMYLKGNLTVNAGAIFNATESIYFEDYNGRDHLPATLPQLVSGSGLYRDTWNTSNSTFDVIQINNTSPTGVSFDIGNITYDHGLNFAAGKVTMLNGSRIQEIENSLSGTFHFGAEQEVGWVNGWAAMPNPIFAGNVTHYTPISFHLDGGGVIQARSFAGDHPSISTSFINPAKSLNYYFEVDTVGTAVLGNYSAITTGWDHSVEDAGIDCRRLMAAKWTGTSWIQTPVSYPTPTSVRLINLGGALPGIYQIGEASSAPIIAQQPTNQQACTGTSVTFGVIFNGVESFRWQINSGAGWIDLANSLNYTGVNTNRLTVHNVTMAYNGNQFRCIGTSYLGATTTSSATLTVMVPVLPTVAVTVSGGPTICAGVMAYFTATPLNASGALTYQWMVNGIPTGTNSPLFSTSRLTNGATVACAITGDGLCTQNVTAVSNTIVMSVSNTPPSSVTIIATGGTNVCAATPVVFTSTAMNAGATPSYQWKKNGVNVGGNTATYTDNSLANGAVITCAVTSTASCNAGSVVTSNTLTMSIVPSVTPSATITANPGTAICTASTVLFTAVPVNGGTAAQYQWVKNGLNVGTNTATYSATGLASGDQVYCVLTSSAMCATSTTATSNTLTLTVAPSVMPTVAISSNVNSPICAGTNVTFTASSTNGGSAPIYQWKKNGLLVDTSVTYSSTALANGDVVICEMASNAACATTANVVSSGITVAVNPVVTPTVTVTTAGATTICAGMSLTFNATITNGGSAPVYAWSVNGQPASGNTAAYASATFQNNDIISCTLLSNATCASTAAATSNEISVTVNPVGASIVTISPSALTTVCAGTPVSFTASNTNGGSAPQNQWQLNGVNTGANSLTYIVASPRTGDVIRCILTSSQACTAPSTSNQVGITVTQSVTPTVSISANPSSNITAGQVVTFTGVPVNGGVLPTYQWKKNGANVGTNAPTFQTGNLANNDEITLNMTSSDSCAIPGMVISNMLKMQVSSSIGRTISTFASLTVYPNPNTGNFSVKGKLISTDTRDVVIDVLDMAGQTIYKVTLPVVNSSFGASMELPTYIARGTYLLKVTSGDQLATKMLVVQ